MQPCRALHTHDASPSRSQKHRRRSPGVHACEPSRAYVLVFSIVVVAVPGSLISLSRARLHHLSSSIPVRCQCPGVLSPAFSPQSRLQLGRSSPKWTGYMLMYVCCQAERLKSKGYYICDAYVVLRGSHP